jgi:4-amino-4-deoxy-L-arabinose transferase-like glycosyltransferase
LKIDKSLLIILFAAVALRVIFVFGNTYISPDGTHYATLGFNFVHSFTYQSDGSHFPDIIQPPFYPFLVGLFSLIFSKLLAGKIVSLVFGVLLVWYVYYALSRLFPNNNIAFYTSWILVLHPGLAFISGHVATESVYLLLLSIAFYAVFAYLKNPCSKKNLLITISLSLAFLTRPEALLFFLVIQFILLIFVLKRKSYFKHLIINFGVFWVVATAYGFSVSGDLGYFSISPKINFVRWQGKYISYLKTENSEPDFKPSKERLTLNARYGLSANSDQLASHALLHKDEDTIQLLLNGREKENQSSNRVAEAGKHIINNIKLIAYKMIKGTVTPPLYIVLFLIGIVFLIKRKNEFPHVISFTILMLLPVSAYLLTHIEERFLLVIVPFGVMIAGFGMYYIDSLLSLKLKSSSVRKGFLIAITALSFVPGYTKNFENLNSSDYYFKVANNIRYYIPEESKLVAAKPQVAFFLGLKYAPLPYAPIEEQKVYYANQQAEYLLIEEKDIQKYPAMDLITDGFKSPFKIMLIDEVNEKKFWLYKIVLNHGDKNGK